MSRIINKFLNTYLGDEVVVQPVKFGNGKIRYYLNSKNGPAILSFQMREDDSYIMFRDVTLCKTISTWFGLSDDNAMRKIRDWFGDKHNIKKFSDLNKFIK